MYRSICVPADNSDYSNVSVDLALTLGKAFGAKLTGSHVYAAKLHDTRFKQMEFTLPDEYKEETELEKQRKIHDALIARGLQLISDSYLDGMGNAAAEAGLRFERKHFDGKNYVALVGDVQQSDYDLVILGALGQGAVRGSLVGSVCERLLRRTCVDTLVVRDLQCLGGVQPNGPQSGSTGVGAQSPVAGASLIVGLDGSAESYGALRAACALARQFGARLEILAVSTTADEQPLLRAHLRVAEQHARQQDVAAEGILLDGEPRARLLERAAEAKPWLVVVGRRGIDADDESALADLIGSTTEHVVRHAECNVLVAARKGLGA